MRTEESMNFQIMSFPNLTLNYVNFWRHECNYYTWKPEKTNITDKIGKMVVNTRLSLQLYPQRSESWPTFLTFIISQAAALGRQILDLTVVFVPLSSEKPPHANLILNCSLRCEASSTFPWSLKKCRTQRAHFLQYYNPPLHEVCPFERTHTFWKQV